MLYRPCTGHALIDSTEGGLASKPTVVVLPVGTQPELGWLWGMKLVVHKKLRSVDS